MKKSPSKKKIVKEVKNTSLYEINFNIDGVDHVSKGETLVEAVHSLKAVPCKLSGLLSASFEGKTSKFPIKLNRMKVAHFFVKPIVRELLAKRLALML